MNFLKNMEVTGQIRPAYAALTVRYDFVNPGGESVSPRYYFPLPEGAVITDMQLLTGAKVLLRSEIVTAASSIYRDCGYCLTRLKSGIYVLSWEGLAPGESCTVVLSYLLRLPQNKDVCTLVLPFGLWLPLLHPMEQNVCPMTVSLTLDGVESRAPYRADRQLEFSEHAQRDIVLEFEVKNPGSVGYVRDEMRGGMGYFRLFSHDRQRYQRWDKDKVQFILDLSGGMELKTVQRVKKLFYDLFLLLPKDTPAELWATGADMPCILTEELMAFAWLQAQKTGGSLHDTLERALAAQSAKTLSVLVSGASILYPEQVLDGISPVCPLHLFITGAGNVSPLGAYWKAKEPGRYVWIAEKREKDLADLLASLYYDGADETVCSCNGTVHELFMAEGTSFAADGYRDIFVTYTGDVPQQFEIFCGGAPTESADSQNEVHEAFPAAGQLYAAEKSRQIKKLLQKTGGSSLRAMKRELENLGTDYHILNDEMALVLPDRDGDGGIAVPFCTAVSDGMEAVFGKKSAFREGDERTAELPKETLHSICRQTLFMGVRADGAICSPCAEETERAEETALAALAMQARSRAAAAELIVKEAEAYLRTAPDGFWKQALFAWKKEPFSLSALRQRMPARRTLLRELLEKNSVRAAAMLLILDL